MSTVIGTKEMFSVFEVIPTTIEEVMTHLDSFITKFLEIADFLEIKSEEEHDYGKFVYIGEKEKDFPIMAIGNSNNASYYLKGIAISRIGTDGKTTAPTCSVTQVVSIAGYVQLAFSTSNSTSIKYLKTSNGMSFGFFYGTNTVNMGCVLSPMVTEGVEGEYINFATINNKYIYLSYVPHGTFDTLTEILPEKTAIMIPSGKYAMVDIYCVYDNSFPYLKLFSGNFAAFKKFEVNDAKYAMVFGSETYWSIVMEIE